MNHPVVTKHGFQDRLKKEIRLPSLPFTSQTLRSSIALSSFWSTFLTPCSCWHRASDINLLISPNAPSLPSTIYRGQSPQSCPSFLSLNMLLLGPHLLPDPIFVTGSHRFTFSRASLCCQGSEPHMPRRWTKDPPATASSS